jgi:hypothetical protein
VRANHWKSVGEEIRTTGNDSAPNASEASLAGQKKYAEAEPLLQEGDQGVMARKDRMPTPDHYQLT